MFQFSNIKKLVSQVSEKDSENDPAAANNTFGGRAIVSSFVNSLNLMAAGEKEKSCVFDMLPNEVLVKIGENVGALNGTKSYVCLARTSRRIHDALMDPETVSKMIQSRLLLVTDTPPGKARTAEALLKAAPRITTLEQMSFFDAVYEKDLIRDNKIILPILKKRDCHPREWNAVLEKADAVNDVMKKYKTASCKRGIHEAQDEDAGIHVLSCIAARFLWLFSTKKYRVVTQKWEGGAMERAPPTCVEVSPNTTVYGWIELHFALPSQDGNNYIQMPKRRGCYLGSSRVTIDHPWL